MQTTKRRASAAHRAYTFFFTHAGYSYDPTTETARQGRAKCAKELAAAEKAASSRGWVFSWEEDADGDANGEGPAESCSVYARCQDCGNVHTELALRGHDLSYPLASLCGIAGADDSYRRVIQAELAAEALARLES
jgi:hypothetical protein